MNLKNQKSIHVFSYPDSFKTEIEAVSNDVKVYLNEFEGENMEFSLAFVQSAEELETLVSKIEGQMAEDALFWFAYPKKSSKKYKASINRDSGWESLGKLGYEGVRAISIDEDWSALRFRKVKHIKSFTRNEGMIWSKEGRERKRT